MAKTQLGTVAQRVQETARRRRIPQAALAESIGLTQQAVSRRLVGLVEISVTEAEQFADALGVSRAWLLLGEASGEPAPQLESI